MWSSLLNLWTNPQCVTEQYFDLVLFIRLYKVVQILKSVDEILVCDHLNESY